MAINSISSTLSYWLNKTNESNKNSTTTSTSFDSLLDNLSDVLSTDSISISSNTSSNSQDTYKELLEERTNLLNQKYKLLKSNDADEETVLDLTKQISLIDEQLDDYLVTNLNSSIDSYNYGSSSSSTIQSLQNMIYYQNQVKLTQAIDTANKKDAELLEKQLEEKNWS